MNLVFDPRVEGDLAEAAGFHEARSEGLGEGFLAEPRKTLDAIISGPAGGSSSMGGPVRRTLVVQWAGTLRERFESASVVAARYAQSLLCQSTLLRIAGSRGLL